MASTYSPTLRIELPATGDQNDAWAATVNNNWAVPIEQGLTGVATVNVPDADVTLTTANAAPDQARMPVLVFTGALTADRFVTIPMVPKVYIIRNNTTGGKSLMFRTGTGTSSVTDTGLPQPFSAATYSGSSTTGVLPTPALFVPAGATMHVWTDGASLQPCENGLDGDIAADSYVPPSPISITAGGTGASTAVAARSNLGLGNAAALDASAPNVANTVAQRDGAGNFEAGTVTAGLSGIAAVSTTTQLFAGLAPTSYSAVDTNWDIVFVSNASYPQFQIVDFMSIAGPGLYIYQLFGGGGFYQVFHIAVPDGTTAPSHTGPVFMSQYVQVSLGFQIQNIWKLAKIF